MEALPFLVIAAILLLWNWWEDKETERRRTAPQRARRATRRLEIDYLARIGAEDYLRRTLIADLRAVRDRQRAKVWIREHYGMEI